MSTNGDLNKLSGITGRRKHSPEIKQLAKSMYLRGLSLTDIAKQMPVSIPTLSKWRMQGHWNVFKPDEDVESALGRRIVQLTALDTSTEAQCKELDRLCKILGQYQLANAVTAKTKAEAEWIKSHGPARASSVNGGSTEKKDAKKREKPIKNDVSTVTFEQLDAVRTRIFTCAYTQIWYAAMLDKTTRRNRFILKSRQIGATYYFAYEALDDAIRTGDNQIFLSASRSQAEVFKAYIIAFAKNELELELKGTDVIILSNGAQLRFLSTNATTAQSYSGHLYIDEVFWIANFTKVNHVASGMATHAKWRKTYFSTPSAQSHQAYPLWNGEKYNAKLPENKRQPFDVSHAAVKNGALFPDGVWRHIVTVDDAVSQGFTYIDIDLLKKESSSHDAFNNLYMCKFIDDAKSVFSLDELLACMLDLDEWDDFNAEAARPFLNKPVSIGYDTGISESGDLSQRALLAIPDSDKAPFRLLSMRRMQGQNFEFQGNRLRDDCEMFNVQFIGLDTNGIGVGVLEQVQKFYPLVTPLHYHQEMKNRLIIKMLDLIKTQRFQLLRRDQDIISSFMLITKSISNGNGAITYKTSRNSTMGHGDSAWAVINAVHYEPLTGSREEATLTLQR